MKQCKNMGGWAGVCSAVISHRLHPETASAKICAAYPVYWRGIEKRTSALLEVIDKFAARTGRLPDHFAELFPSIKPSDYTGVLRQYEKIYGEWVRQIASEPVLLMGARENARAKASERVKEEAHAAALKALAGKSYVSWETLIRARINGVRFTPDEMGGRLDYTKRGAYPRSKKIENVNLVLDAIDSHVSKNGCLPIAFPDIEGILPAGHRFSQGEGYVIFQTWSSLVRC